jgi:hypothetical protein
MINVSDISINSSKPAAYPDSTIQVRVYVGKAAADRRAAIAYEKSRLAVKQQMVRGIWNGN